MKRNSRRVLFAVAAIVVLAGGLAAYDYIRLNLWIDRDAGRLGDYPILLIEQNKEIPRKKDAFEQIDRILIDELSSGRNVVTMSRHEIKFNILRTRAYAKVLLETAAPNEPDLRSSLKLVCEFRRGDGGWVLAGPPKETTLE